MANRIIKESICESKGLSEVSFFAEDLYKRLITYADDYGRFNADYQIILARLYPREIQIVSLDDIEDALTELIGAGKIRFYTSNAKKEVYGCFPNWGSHQRLRESKAKAPEPDNTDVNDWYLRRFVPHELKKKIIERDGFKCQMCSKYICAGINSAERLIKMGAGLYHIDHIVPVGQGGRATEENLRLLCPKCNLGRKKRFTFEELVEIGNLPQTTASCGELRQTTASCGLNPIQYESNPNPNPNPNILHGAPQAGASVPDEAIVEAAVEAVVLNTGDEWRPTVEQYEAYARLYPGVDIAQEFRKMRGWCDTNPKKRKTRTGVLRFVNAWLSRAQDSQKPNKQTGSAYMDAIANRVNAVDDWLEHMRAKEEGNES